MDLFHHIFMGRTNIMGHELLKIHGKFMYYAYMIIPLNSHDYFHGNFMAFGLVVYIVSILFRNKFYSCWLSVEENTIFAFVAPMLAIVMVR